MGSECSGSDLLLERFPEISFFLNIEERPQITLFQDEKGYFNGVSQKGSIYGEDVEKEIQNWKESLFLEGIEVLYIYGAGLGYHYEALLDWLDEEKGRILLFIEDDLSILDALFSLPIGKEMLEDSRVHFFYLNASSWEAIFEETTLRFISNKVEFTCLKSYGELIKKKVKGLRLSLLRKSTLVHVGMTELIQYPLLMRNIAANFREVPHSFHVNKLKGVFSGIPAIICGAGVSLREAIPLLKGLEQKALIFAGGSTITALSYHGIRPHVSMALDPNDEEYERLKGHSLFEVPFVYSSRLAKEVLASSNVKGGYLCSDTGGSFENWMQEQLSIDPQSLGPELGVDALSVTTLATPLAVYLGCGPILFCGVDLSYQNKERYTSGVLASSQVFTSEIESEERSMEKLVRRKNGEGRVVQSLVKWVMEASCIGSYAKKNQGTGFFNASFQGLPIPHVPLLSLADFIHRYCDKEFDLRGLLQLESEVASLSSISSSSILAAFKTLYDSLDRLSLCFRQMVREIEDRLAVISDPDVSLESGKMTLLEMDLVEEASYSAAIQNPFFGYQRVLERHYPLKGAPETLIDRQRFLEKKKAVWEETQEAIRVCMDLLSEHLFRC
jgi:hypothetical protein